MTDAYTNLSAAAQAALANLATAALQSDLERGVEDLPGGFTRKEIKGRTYWYYQYKTAGKAHQTYVGPDDNPTVRELVDRHRQGKQEGGASSSHLRRLCAAALALGCPAMIPAHVRVLKRLGDHGFFRAGGILIGTHAFLVYQNMLGVTWTAGTMTMDMDFAHPRKPPEFAQVVDTTQAIESLRMGFIPNNARTTYIKQDETDFQIDFVTSRGRDGDEPVHLAGLNITLQPLKFMEYSMEDVQPTIALSADGPIVVRVPAPERFALHKLIVAGERGAKMATKSYKDIEQAHCLISYLAEHRPASLEDAFEDLMARGKGWRSRFQEGLRLLHRRHPGTDLALLGWTDKVAQDRLSEPAEETGDE